MRRIILKISGIFFFLPAVVLAGNEPPDMSGHYHPVHTDTGSVEMLNRKAMFFLQTEPDSAFYYASAAKGQSERLNYPAGTARALLYISNYYNAKGSYILAMSHALRALKISDSLHSPPGVGDARSQIAYIYKTMAGQNRTPSYLDSGIAMSSLAYHQYTMAKDTAGMANSLNITGILYRDKYYAHNTPQYFDTAFTCYQTAIDMITVSGAGTQYMGKLYNNISQFYSEYKNQYRTALLWLFKAVEFNEERNNRVSLLYNYGNISFCYRQMKDYTRAEKYAQLMLAGAENIKQPHRKHDALYELYQIYKEERRYNEALKYYILADRINDSLTNTEKTREVAELKNIYETEKKEVAIRQLNAEKENIQKRNGLLIIGISLFFLLSIGLMILYRRTQRQKKEIVAQSARLSVMMRELHHRVKNNLQIVSSLLSLQAYNTDDEKSVSTFRESQQRVQAMSLIHQRLYNTGDIMTVNMKEYITDLAEALLSSFGYHRDDFLLQIDVDKEKLEVDKALPLGLIINEIVTNAMKYAYPHLHQPALLISLKEEHPNLILLIRDNGRGIDLAAWNDTGGSFGKQLINALCRQLHGNQHITVEAGTQFMLSIPVGKAA